MHLKSPAVGQGQCGLLYVQSARVNRYHFLKPVHKLAETQQLTASRLNEEGYIYDRDPYVRAVHRGLTSALFKAPRYGVEIRE